MNTTIQNQKPCIQQPGVSWNALWRPTNIHISSRRLARAKPRSIRVPAIITTASSGKTARPRGDTGVRHPASDITVKSILGEGSFGQVFEGQLVLGNGTEEHVVLKRVKQRVKGASEMAEMEHVLNVYAAKAAKDAVADFLGFCEVYEEDTKANKRLTPGLWLIWRYEGRNTLAYYLRRRDCLSAIAADLGVPLEAVVPTVMKQLFENLQALHAAGLVHRDVKPLNVILNESQQRFKFIDLGAMADLRTGTNYVPDESIMDPAYSAPEQYILPTQGPDLARMLAPLSLAMSPVLWQQHKPDRFDMYSAGLIMMQLSLQRLRTPSQLKTFARQLADVDYDLFEWRQRIRPPARETTVLDANEEAGWKLAAALLRPRRIEVDTAGHVVFAQGKAGEQPRPSAAEALKFTFVTQGAAEPGTLYEGVPAGEGAPAAGESAREGAAVAGAVGAAAGSMRGLFTLLRRVTDSLFDAEAKLVNQASATQRQATQVRQLRAQVKAKRANPEVLQEAEKTYTRMSTRLDTLSKQFDEEASLANTLMKRLGMAGKSLPRAADVLGMLGLDTNADVIIPNKTNAAVTNTATPKWAAARVQPGTPPSSSSSSAQPAKTAKGGTAAGASAGTAGNALSSSSTPATPSRVKTAAVAGSGSSSANTGGTGGGGNAEDGKGSAWGAFATSLLYQGLKLTATAVTAAADLAVKVGKEAEAAMAEAEARAAARKRATAAFKAAMDLLPVTSVTTWDKAKGALAAMESDPNQWSDVLAEADLRALLEARATALLQEEEEARAEAATAFMGLLREACIKEGVPWKLAKRDVEGDERYDGVENDRERQRVYKKYQLMLKAQREAAEEVANREEAFRQLLLEQDVRLLAAGSWVAVRGRVADDARFRGVDMDRRRKEIYLDVVEAIKDHAAVQAALNEAQVQRDLTDAMLRGVDRKPKSGRVAWTAHTGGGADSGEVEQARSRLLLDELREKQRRLKAEYDAMEEQLVAMEASLGVQASKQSAAEVRRTQQQKAAKVGGTKTLETVEQDDAGNVTFRFAADGEAGGERGSWLP